MQRLVVLTGILAFVSFKTCESDLVNESLNKQLLRSAQTSPGLPIPNVYLALRLSSDHNHAIETEYLNKITSDLHNDIQRSLSQSKPVVGLLSQYTMCVLASCNDVFSVAFTVNDHTVSLVTHLKRQMHQEKESIDHSQKPLSNYFTFSGGILALCLAGVRVNVHLTSHLITAIQHDTLAEAGGACSTDTLSMAGMALSCEKNAGLYTHNAAALDRAINKIKDKLETTSRPDFHIGNEFSTPIAIMALVAMGSQKDLSSTLLSLRADAERGTYHNPMALSSALMGLQTKTYLDVKNMNCQNEKNNLVLEPAVEVDLDLEVVPIQKATVIVEVVKSNLQIHTYTVHVAKGSSLLTALELIQQKNAGFTFEVEPSQWGPFLSNVNGEHARQSDGRAWFLLADGVPLTEGINDFKIERPHVIIIRNTVY